MANTTPDAPQAAELFTPDLLTQPVRSFTETGWGRFPIAADAAGLNCQAFAVYVRISVAADSREAMDKAKLAERCRLSPEAVDAALEELGRRSMLEIEGETWTLTDPTEWLP